MPIQQGDREAGVRAELHLGGDTLRYRRRGTGSPCLLLMDGTTDGSWAALEGVLAQEGRLLVPDLEHWGGDREGERVGRMLEGLGLGAAVLVVNHEPLADGVLALAQRAPELVRRVVIVGGSVPGGAREVRLETWWGEHCPMLLLDASVPAAEAIPLVVRFLAAPAPR